MLTKLSIEQIDLGIMNKEFSYKELIQSYYNNFQRYKNLNTSISDYWEDALKHADLLDNSTNKKHILTGVPISIKDMFLVKDTRTTAASKVLENFIAPYESHVTNKLSEANYIMPFKNNLDEFAMGSSTMTSVFGPVINPWIVSDGLCRVPGGSSGGSAASVAARLSLASLGTDTGGSVRQPGSFCGVVGFKPTYGRCSRRGIISFASSLDHPGIFSRNVQDACIIFEQIAGYDKYETTSLNKSVPRLSSITSDIKGKVFGVQFDLFNKILPEYRGKCLFVIKEIEKAGGIVKEIQLPSLELAIKLYYVLAPAEAASNLARYDGLRFGHKEGSSFEEILSNSRDLFGKEVKKRILIGNFVLSSKEYNSFFGKAYQLRKDIQVKMHCLFKDIDVFLLPTSPGVAFGLNEIRSTVEMYYEDLFTVLANIYGGPSIQVPIGLIEDKNYENGKVYNGLLSQEGLPIGMQVFGACECEDKIISFAKKIEEIVQFEGLKD